MRQSIKRAGYLMVAAMLALLGVVTVTGTASATRESTTMATGAVVQSCPFPPANCVQDTGIIQPGTRAITFCASDIFNLIYSVQRERGGFVNRTTLSNPNEADCGNPRESGGGFGQVHTTSTLRARADGTGVNFGTINSNTQVDVFCDHAGSYLIYYEGGALAGFLPASSVTVVGNPTDC